MSIYDDKKKELQELLDLFRDEKKGFKGYVENQLWHVGKKEEELQKERDIFSAYLENEREKIQDAKKAIEEMAKERQKGFPWLAKAYDEFFELQDKEVVSYLRKKKHPAIKTAGLVKEQSQLRRKAEAERKIAEYVVEFYENMCPFLIDLKEEEVGNIEEVDQEALREYTPEELEDEATRYLTREEYRKLPTAEKNQMALDRYWKRPKSKWHIGKMYERYVGHLFEEKGYDVEYVGIFKGFEDLGRDLIATKGKEVVVIQCKYWSKYRTIYEKHIFQFFGTVFKYKDDNKGKKVKGIFYCTTKLSDLARRFSKELGIGLEEEFAMDKNYPCIKCNIGRATKEKIYHLPFDQQYDTVKIEYDKGEFYCATVTEAEKKGFRRAYKYKGSNK